MGEHEFGNRGEKRLLYYFYRHQFHYRCQSAFPLKLIDIYIIASDINEILSVLIKVYFFGKEFMNLHFRKDHMVDEDHVLDRVQNKYGE